MRALVWASFVMMPDCEPVKLTAGTPRAFSATPRSAIEMRSPAESSMSSSRRAGRSVMRRARASSSSVVSPIAETTTTTSSPRARVAATRSATFSIRATSATDDPPYFWTTTPTADPPRRASVGRPGWRWPLNSSHVLERPVKCLDYPPTSVLCFVRLLFPWPRARQVGYPSRSLGRVSSAPLPPSGVESRRVSNRGGREST